jgi:AraC-like DNA-binding protein
MYQRHCTADVPRNHEFGFWREVIGNTYFNLQLAFKDTQRFRGSLEAWSLGMVSLSKLDSSPLQYQRLRQHCQQSDPQILVTVPLRSEVQFSQLGRQTSCLPGQFILEHSDEPYEFSHGQDNSMWVLKLPESALRARVGNTSRFCAMHFDTTQGLGQLFSDYLQLITRHCNTQQSAGAMALMGTQLMDLLGTALKETPSALQSNLSAVRTAHLARVEAFLREHLADPNLSPELIATRNGISLRYLHDLFKDTGQSVSQWIREMRLQSAYEQLSQDLGNPSVAQVAYACGFSDHAQFSTAFKKRFHCTPSQRLKERLPTSH